MSRTSTLIFLFISKKLLKEDDVYEVKRQCLPIFLLRGESSPVVAGGICQSWRLKSPKKPVSGFCPGVSFPRWALTSLARKHFWDLSTHEGFRGTIWCVVYMNDASFLKAEIGLQKLEEWVMSGSSLRTCLHLFLAVSKVLKFLCDPELDKREWDGCAPSPNLVSMHV